MSRVMFRINSSDLWLLRHLHKKDEIFATLYSASLWWPHDSFLSKLGRCFPVCSTRCELRFGCLVFSSVVRSIYQCLLCYSPILLACAYFIRSGYNLMGDSAWTGCGRDHDCFCILLKPHSQRNVNFPVYGCPNFVRPLAPQSPLCGCNRVILKTFLPFTDVVLLTPVTRLAWRNLISQFAGTARACHVFHLEVCVVCALQPALTPLFV